MMRVNGYGVMITGAAGIGKSSFALALLERGHQLIADDLVLLQRDGQQLIASCPETLTGLLHSRELGLLNIPQLFGEKAVHTQHPVDLIVQLSTEQQPHQLEPAQTETLLQGVSIPMLTLSPLSPSSLSLRLEIWLKNWPIQADTVADFGQKQQQMMQQ